jgi:demethylmenaquinone methyltransferase / 2-methoxy-6-polyprenyl-1,4-benzoquinol methylase
VRHDLGGELVRGRHTALHRFGERGAARLAERLLEPRRGRSDRVEVGEARDAGRGLNGLLQLGGCELGVLDPFGILGQPQLDEPRAQLAEVASARALLGQLAESGERHRVPDEPPLGDGMPFLVEREPGALAPVTMGVRTEVEARPAGLGRDDADDFVPRLSMRVSRLPSAGEIVLERHASNNSPVAETLTERNQAALELFAPLAATYDRYARLLSFGQDGRWRRFLVSRIEAGPGDRVLDVACGTGAVALELVRAHGCRVVGIDQSSEMLAAGRSRIASAGRAGLIALREGRAEELPFPDASFDALTFTYLLRYVDDPGATLSELARVVRPGGVVAGLEFFIPRNALTRISWKLYTRTALPLLGGLASPGWRHVGEFLGPNIEDFWARYPIERLLDLWRQAGLEDVHARTLSLGGGVVIWGRRGE